MALWVKLGCLQLFGPVTEPGSGRGVAEEAKPDDLGGSLFAHASNVILWLGLS